MARCIISQSDLVPLHLRECVEYGHNEIEPQHRPQHRPIPARASTAGLHAGTGCWRCRALRPLLLQLASSVPVSSIPKRGKPPYHRHSSPTMSLLLASSPALAPFKPATCRTQHNSRLAPIAAQRRQERQHSAAAVAAAAAASLAGSLAASPAALAAAPTSAAAAAAAASDPQAAAAAQAIAELALLDSQSAGALSAVLKPALSLASLLMIVRIVMSWYPEIDGKVMPWSIAYTPTGETGGNGGMGGPSGAVVVGGRAVGWARPAWWLWLSMGASAGGRLLGGCRAVWGRGR